MIFLTLIFYLFGSPEGTVFSSSLKSCQDQCAEKNLAFPLGRGELTWKIETIASCGFDCAIKSCHYGCQDLEEPSSRCLARCSEEGIVFDSCLQGCQAVEQSFLVQVQELVNTVSVSIEPAEGGLKLKFAFPEVVSPQLQEIAAGEVGQKFSVTQSFFGPMDCSFTIKNRTPRMEMDTTRRNVSRAIEYDSPQSSQPIILKFTHKKELSDDSVALCWNITRPEATVKLSVSLLDGTEVQSFTTNKKCRLLKNLPSDNCCRLTATDATVPDDPSPSSNSTSLKFKKIEDLLMASTSEKLPQRLLMVNGSHLLQMRNVDDYVVSEEPLVIPIDLPEGELLSALCGISPTEVVVGSNRGALWKVSMEFNETQIESDVVLLRESQGETSRIWQIVHDGINGFVYAVVGEQGVLRCPLEKRACTFAPNVDSLNPVRQIAIDAVNGFIYLVGADHQTYKTTLFPFNSGESRNFSEIKPISDLSSATSIFFDWTNYELYAALKNSSVVVLDTISQEIKEKRHTEYMEVTRLSVQNGRLFWTREKCGEAPIDAVCFYSEDQKNSEGEKQPYFSRYLYAATLNDFTFLTHPPFIRSLRPFSSVSMISTDSEALISWLEYPNEPFAASGFTWWNISTEVKVSHEAKNQIYYANGTNLTISVLPGMEYSVNLRRCHEDVCSAYVSTSDTALAKQPFPPVLLISRISDAPRDVLGRPVEMPTAIGFSLPNDMHRPFAVDNSTLSYFYVTPSDVWVNRGNLDGTTNSPFTGHSTITHLATAPSRALLFVATPYQIISFRFTGTFDHTFYSCVSASEECGQVVALSVDDASGELHYVLRMPKGTLVLFEANQEDRTPRLLSESNSMPEVKHIFVSHEKLFFITTEGTLGVCDKHMENININTDINSIAAFLPLTLERATNLGSFSGEIMMSTEKKDKLLWNLEPRKIIGKTLFKVSLYREKLGVGEKRVEVTTQNSLTLPPDLLDSWSSAQKFDVNVEGFTAWTSFTMNKTSLQAPVKPPGPPTGTSIYATQQKTVDGARAIISFFWSTPLQWNGTPFQYIVNCSKEDGTTQGGTVSSAVTHFSFAVKSGKVSCKVAAANEPNNIGAYSEPVVIDSSELKPLVRLFAIDSTNALMAITDISNDLTARREKRQIAQVNRMEYQAIAFIGNDLFAVRKESDSIQPLLVQIDTNDIDNIVHKVSIGGDVGRIEAMTSDWVANRLLFVSGMALYQISLDPFLTTSLLNPRKLIELSTVATDAKQLTFDPFKNIAYLLTRNGSLFSLNLWKEKEENLALGVPCLSSQTVTWMMTEFAWNRASSPKIYALTWNGLIVVDLEENNKCNEVRIDWNKFGEKGLKAMSAFAIADKLFVFVTSSEMLIYGRETVVPIPISNPPLRQILAVSQSSQPFPDRSCFALPTSSGIQFSVVNEGKTGAFLDVQKPPLPTACAGVSFPQTHYEVYFTRKNAEKVKHIRSFTDKIHVENGILDKETDYEVTVAWLNRYSDANGISDPRPFRTGFGYPSAPRELQVISVTPDTVFLYWTLPETLNAPINEIKYKVTQQAAGLSSPSTIAVQEFAEGGFAPLAEDTASCLSSPCRAKIANLRASTEYKFWVTAIHAFHLNKQFLEDSEATSPEATARTKDIAGTLRPDNVTGSSILLRWNSLQAELAPATISVQYKESGSSLAWKAPTNASFDPNVPTLLVLINNLLSATTYDYRFVAAYTGSYSVGGKEYSYKEEYYQGVQQIKTKAGVPTSPINVESRIDEEGWIVSWQEPLSDGGSPITSYAVEMRINKTAEWEIADRGLDGWKLWWRPAKSHKDEKSWEFRVRAANAEGFGPYANTTDNYEIGMPEDPTSASNIIIFLIVIGVLVIICLLIYFGKSYILSLRLKKKKLEETRNCITLEKMAGCHNQTDEQFSAMMLREVQNLPSFGQEEITVGDSLEDAPSNNLKNYEICEGHIKSHYREEMVAVKRLLEGFHPSYKNKLIKEAILLNNFDHPHILRLLGVCLESRLPFMVVEYMQEGNLRELLASCAEAGEQSQVSLRDFLGFMVDIGRAGDYLESQRHVYRVLTARSCFITREHGARIVKLGDFGILRGVFDENYFSKENGDYLPVRWLSPEAALNEKFSTKSDVWSFGAVLFEILSLGSVPYNHCTTVQQVLARLRAGDIPSRPRGCPGQLYNLMKKCFIRLPEERPRFSELVNELEHLREIPEFQDEKPYFPSGAHYNEGFDISIDSACSDKQDPKESSIFNESFSTEPVKFDRSGTSLGGGRKNSRPSLGRSQRKEKSKPAPLPHPEEIDSIFGFKQGEHSSSSFDQGFSSSMVPRSPFSTYSSFDPPSGARRGFSAEGDTTRPDESVHLSHSWAPGMIEQAKYLTPSLQAQPRPSSASLSQQRKARTGVPPSSSSGSNYHPKISQV